MLQVIKWEQDNVKQKCIHVCKKTWRQGGGFQDVEIAPNINRNHKILNKKAFTFTIHYSLGETWCNAAWEAPWKCQIKRFKTKEIDYDKEVPCSDKMK